VPDQWKQGVGGLVRRYRRRIVDGISWSDDHIADGVRKGVDDLDDLTVSSAEFPGMHGSLSERSGSAEQEGEFADLFAIRADDELLDALGAAASNGRSGPDPDREYGGSDLESLLAAWRNEAEADPIPMLCDTETAAAVIQQSVQARRRSQRRWLVPVASAAAVLVIAFTSLGVAVRDAQPGDPLWGLTQVLYADHAKSLQAAVTVRTELSHASIALQEGHFTEARTALSQAQAVLPSVDNSDGKADLQLRGQQLAAQLYSATTNEVTPPSTTSTTPRTSAPSPTPTTSTSPTTTTPVTTTPASPTPTTPTTSTSPTSPTTSSGSQSAAGPGTITTPPQTDTHPQSIAGTGPATGSS
jgi:hypothetical protein